MAETSTIDTPAPDRPLRVFAQQWVKKIRMGVKFKDAEFQSFAEECMDFYVGKGDEIWNKWMSGKRGMVHEDTSKEEGFRFAGARVAELVQLYGPGLYHRNPVRTVTQRNVDEFSPDDFIDQSLRMRIERLSALAQQSQQQQMPLPPAMQWELQQAQIQFQSAMRRFEDLAMQSRQRMHRADIRGRLLKTLLNYTPNEFDLKRHSRKAIDEALIKGMGILVTEGYRAHDDAPYMIRSVYYSVDRLIIDPDAEEIEDANWIAIECLEPIWQVAERYGVKEKTLREKCKSAIQSLDDQANERVADDDGEINRKGKSNDLIRYHKVWSRQGMGGRLSGIPEVLRNRFEDFGKNVYLVIADGMDSPLNLKAKALRGALKSEKQFDRAFERVQWPIPFHRQADDPWPFTPLIFHDIPNHAWPLAHVRCGLPELKFGNYVRSYMADLARNTSRLLILTLKSLDEETLEKILHGGPVENIPLSQSEIDDVRKALSFVTPTKGVVTDFQTVLGLIDQDFDKRTGLDEGMYAAPGGVRSATEANLKQSARNIRPDDMANKVEDWQSAVARKEALAWIWLAEREDVLPVVGEVGADLWERYVMEADPFEVAAEFDYRIESGSARKPNRETQQFNAQQFLTSLMPLLQQYWQMSADPRPVNEFIAWWMEVNDVQHPERFQLQPPPPPQPDPNEQTKLSIEQMKAQAEQQKMQLDMQIKMLEAQIKQQTAQMEIEQKREEHQLEVQSQQAEMQMDQQRFQMESQQDQENFEREFTQDQQMHQMQMQQTQQQSQQEMSLSRMLGEGKVQQQKQLGDQKVQQAKQMAAAKPTGDKGAGAKR